MAMMDDRAFLISHIRQSFITSDDTNMCETVIEPDVQEAMRNNNKEHISKTMRPTTWHGHG